MSDDLIAIIACCILGLLAHGSRRHYWLEWVLRVVFGLFLLTELLNISAEPSVEVAVSNPWTYGVLVGTAVCTAVLMFRPGRQLFSLIFTIINQIAGGRVFLAAMGKLQVQVQPALVVRKGPVQYIAPAKSFKTSSNLSTEAADSSGSAAAIPGAEPGKEADDSIPTIVDSPELSNEASTTALESAAGSSDEAAEAGDSSAADQAASSELSAKAVELSPEENHTDSELSKTALAGSEPAAEPAGSLPEQETAAATGPAGQAGTQPATAASSATDNSELNDSLIQEAPLPQPDPQPVYKKASVLESFLAERIFNADSVPHMNALWIYVTCLAFLFTHTEPAGFQMPAIMIPIPVTFDQLFSYNFLGLILLAVCGTGIFISRKPMEVMRRLGLVKPTLTQVLLGIAGIFVTFAYDYLWSTYTHSQEGLNYADKLTHYNEGTFSGGASPAPAFLVASATGLCAGLGEETLIRGALQPVFGIVLAALMHGALHGQFSHAPLLIVQVFGWSTMMGILRRYTNTTTTIITHVGFNFLSTFLFAFNP